MQMFTLRRLRPSIAWLGNFQRLQRKFMRHSLAIFSTSRTALRVQALLFIRQMASMIPDPAMDQALKVRTHRCSVTLQMACSIIIKMYASFRIISKEHNGLMLFI